VINCFIHSSGRPLRSPDICSATGLSSNRIFRILATLSKWEYLEKNPKTNEYSLGPSFLILGELYRNNRQILREAAASIIRDLAEKSGDTANLIVPYMGVNLAQIEAYQGKYPLQGKLGLGDIHPMVPYGIVSMFWMATLPEAEKARLIEYLESRNDTGRKIIDRVDLERKIQAAIQQGYAVADVAFEPGIICISAPIIDETKTIIAVVGLIVPKVRFTEKDKQQKINYVVDAANQISNRLGYFEESRINFFG
jgi:IclR family KDG regulon transcriptional repressor